MDSLFSFPVGFFHPLQHAGLSRRSTYSRYPVQDSYEPQLKVKDVKADPGDVVLLYVGCAARQWLFQNARNPLVAAPLPALYP
jgi:hypothetical protein